MSLDEKARIRYKSPPPKRNKFLVTVTYQAVRAYVVTADDNAGALRKVADRKLGERKPVFDAVVKDDLAVTADALTPDLKTRISLVTSKGW